MNGGYQALKDVGIWKHQNVYADTALAYKQDIADFIESFSVEKIFFGSDYPFGNPLKEKKKILSLGLSDKENELILSKNIINLLKLEEATFLSK